MPAEALRVPVSQVDFGPDIRGIDDSGYEILIAAYYSGPGEWTAYVDEWRAPQRGERLAPRLVAQRLTTGMRTPGSTPAAALDALEAESRALVTPYANWRESDPT